MINIEFDVKCTQMITKLCHQFDLPKSDIIRAGLMMVYAMSDGNGEIDKTHEDGRTMFLIIDEGESIIDAIQKLCDLTP